MCFGNMQGNPLLPNGRIDVHQAADPKVYFDKRLGTRSEKTELNGRHFPFVFCPEPVLPKGSRFSHEL
jgi:hypothetical protein